MLRQASLKLLELLHRVIAIHQKSLNIQSREPFLLLHIFHTPSCCYPHNLKAQCTHASHLLYRSPCFKRRHTHTLNYLPPSRIIKTHRITTTNSFLKITEETLLKKIVPLPKQNLKTLSLLQLQRAATK
jgi:hypothetical protein